MRIEEIKPKIKGLGWALVAGLLMLTSQREASAVSACLSAGFNDCYDLGLCQIPIDPQQPQCPTCPGMPRWWVTEPYISLHIADEPLSYYTSSGEKMSFRWTYWNRACLPDPYYSRFFSAPSSYTVVEMGKPGAYNGNDYLTYYTMTNAMWSHNWWSEIVFWDPYLESDSTAPSGPRLLTLPSGAYLEYYPMSPNYTGFVMGRNGGIIPFDAGSATSPVGSTKVRVQMLGQPSTAGGPEIPVLYEDQTGYEGTYYQTNSDGVVWVDNPQFGFQVTYPDGSRDIYGFVWLDHNGGNPTAWNSVYETPLNNTCRAYLTQHIDPQGRKTCIGYQWQNATLITQPQYLVRYVVDSDGRTNTYTYNPNNTWQLQQVQDPYGRTASFGYDPSSGMLTSITDAAHLTSSFDYQPASGASHNGWITNLVTPYGATEFGYFEDQEAGATNQYEHRALLVTEPDNAHQLYLFQQKCTGNETAALATGVPQVNGWTFDNGNVTSPNYTDCSLQYRNSYHWGRRQFDDTPDLQLCLMAGQLGYGITNLSASDYYNAHMSHWLLDATDPNQINITDWLSSEREPSRISGSGIAEPRTWYAYAGQVSNAYFMSGTDPLPGCIAMVLPDGSTRYQIRQHDNYGNLIQLQESYSLPNSQVGARTNSFAYAINGIDLVAVTNALGQWTTLGYNGNHQPLFITNALNQVSALTWDPNSYNLTGIQLFNGQSVTLSYYGSNSSSPNGSLVQNITWNDTGRSMSFSYTNSLPLTIHASDTGVAVSITTNTVYVTNTVITTNDGVTYVTNSSSPTNSFILNGSIAGTNFSGTYTWATNDGYFTGWFNTTNADWFVMNYGPNTYLFVNSSLGTYYYAELLNSLSPAPTSSNAWLASVGTNLYNNISTAWATTNTVVTTNYGPSTNQVVATSYIYTINYSSYPGGGGLADLWLTNSWDGLNRLTGTAFQDGTTTSNTYQWLDLSGFKDRLGNWTRYGYDSLEHLTSITNALTNVTTLTWCGCGSLTTIIDPLLNTNSFNYNNQGLLTNVLFADGSSLGYTYDSADLLVQVADGSGRALTAGYNNQGLLTMVSNAFGPLQSIVFDAGDRPIQITDANGVTVTHQYDPLDRLTLRTWAADGISESFVWATNGLVAYTNRDQKVTLFARDTAGRVAAVTNANMEVTMFAYNSLSQLTDLWDGRVNHTGWSYNQYGWLTNKTDARSDTAFAYAYNANGQVTNRWTPQFGNTGYVYDSVGNLKAINYPLATVSYWYDALNRLTNMVDASGTTAFSYTQTSQLKSEVGPWANDTIAYGYTQRLRTSLSVNSQPSAFGVTYGYDPAFRLQTLAATAGNFGYSYAGPASPLVSGITLPNFASITNHYDPLARLDFTALVNRWGGMLDATGYQHDPLGLRTNVTRYLGVTTNAVAVGYDSIGQITSWSADNWADGLRQNEQFGFGFDKAGNLISRTNGGLVQSFICDPVNELTNITRNGVMTVSGALPGLATSVTVNGSNAQQYGDFTFAATNQSLANGQNTFTIVAHEPNGGSVTNSLVVNLPTSVALRFDLNGNLTNDGTRSFAYSAENQLTNIFVAGSWRSMFVYDGLGRRRISRDYTWNGGWVLTNEVHYVYDGMLPVQELDTNSNVLVTYTRGLDVSSSRAGAGGIGGLLARTDGNGSTFYHADGAGNITSLIDGNENIAARYLYSAFGRLIGQSGPMAGVNEMQFSSMPFHRQTSMSLFPFRAYDPTLQRWLNRDPIGEAGGVNVYGFVGNDPMSSVDPYGLTWAVFSLEAWGQLVHDLLFGDHAAPTVDPNSLLAQEGVNNNFGGETGAQVVTDIGAAVPKGIAAAAMMVPLGGEEGAYAAADEALQAARAARLAKCNWRSVKRFGHTFSRHGAKRAIQELVDRARALGPQGQWLDNEKAADFLAQFEGRLTGPTTVPLPPGLGQIVNADGSIVPAVQATLVPSPTGFTTAYPIP
jgi:RHS repeat-associated protein